MTIILNTGDEVKLTIMKDRNLTGVYALDETGITKKITVQAIVASSVRNFAGISNIYTIPDEKSTINNGIALDDLCSFEDPDHHYRRCFFGEAPQTFTELQDDLMCEGLVEEDYVKQEDDIMSRHETLNLAVNMLRRKREVYTDYNNTYSDVYITPGNQEAISTIQT